MSYLLSELDALRNRIASGNDADLPGPYLTYLSVTVVGDDAHLDFYGNPFDDCYTDLLQTLAKPPISKNLRSLTLRGPDEGANGTRAWDLGTLFQHETVFPRLETFHVQRTDPSDHNRSIIGETYEENGQIAHLLRLSPALRYLTVPSAPNTEFFKTTNSRLEYLNVDAGYDTQDFIACLSESDAFPRLRSLEWGEYNETYLENWEANCTSYEDYALLFTSAAFSAVTRFVWRNPVCSEAQLKLLKQMRSDLQILVICTSHAYI